MKGEIISRFKEKPKTSTAWWAMGLGSVAFLLGPGLQGFFTTVIRPAIEEPGDENTVVTSGFNLGGVSLILFVFALVICILAFKKGERSWVLWVGFVPAVLSGAYWIYRIIIEFIPPH